MENVKKICEAIFGADKLVLYIYRQIHMGFMGMKLVNQKNHFETASVTHYTLTYLEAFYQEDGSLGYMSNNSETFAENDLKTAQKAFDLRSNSSNPYMSTKLGIPVSMIYHNTQLR